MRIHRSPRKAEQVIRATPLPPSVMAKVARAHPELRPAQLAAVERGLREWLICCAHRDGAQLGMPSRAVDWAWHELILDTPAYHRLCHAAYGEYLHHVPEAAMDVSIRIGLRETVRAWDPSEDGRHGHESSLWQLDERLGIDDPIGVGAMDLRAASGGGRRAAAAPLVGAGLRRRPSRRLDLDGRRRRRGRRRGLRGRRWRLRGRRRVIDTRSPRPVRAPGRAAQPVPVGAAASSGRSPLSSARTSQRPARSSGSTRPT
jgi:hypothetical protein